jgi:hypothetical protein
VWTGGVFRPIVMQHGSSSIAESRKGPPTEWRVIAARRRIDVLWALLRDNRTWAPGTTGASLKRLDNPQ